MHLANSRETSECFQGIVQIMNNTGILYQYELLFWRILQIVKHL